MGGKVVSSSKLGKLGGSVSAVLASALLEWILIFMLIVYGIFGYLITKFARYCGLPIPCLLCSRIDNVLGGGKPGFYWDMICGNHKLEISSLVYCHFHEKLVDVRGMCESCLFSFATKDKSNAETYRLLVGKLGEEDPSGFDEGTSFDNLLTLNLKHCSCCNELWNPRRPPQTLVQTKSTGFDVPLSREASRDLDSLEKDAMKTQASSTIIHVREMAEDYSLEKEANKTQASSTTIRVREKTEDPLAHFGFTELKISSDTESDIQASDIHDSLEEANESRATSNISHVRVKTEDPLAHFGYTELKISSDAESDIQGSNIHDSLEEDKKPQASSTIIHVREKTEDPLAHFGYTELKISSDTESDIQGSNIHDSLEEDKKLQASSTIIHVNHVREKTEDPLAHFGFTELKISSDTESDFQASNIYDSLEKENRFQASSTIVHVIEQTEDHFGFTELKITSDTESDIQISDIEDPLEDLISESTQVGPFISLSEDVSASKKPIDQYVLSRDSAPPSPDLEPSNIIQPRDITFEASSPVIGHGLEELNWQEIDHKPNVGESKEMLHVIDDIPNPLVSTEIIGVELLSNTQNGDSIPLDSAKGEFDANEATVETVAYVTDKSLDLENLQPPTNLNSSETRSEHTDGDVQIPNYLELSDAYKLAVSSRGRQLSEKLSEQLTGKNSSSTNLDLKVLLSQFSRGLNLPSTGILSPRVSRNLDELKTSDTSPASFTMKFLQKRASLERNDSRNSVESALESLDFSTVGDMDGESEVDRLKRQLEHDRRFLTALLKELEEERNASASATNEAMAMITRLQEEKAAVQMEASHHLRMMEEQAEYDMDALDKLNELVTEKEKEIQMLEEELDYYRIKYPNEQIQDDVEDPHSGASPHDPWLVTQEERDYLSKCLRNLEEKLRLFSDDEENSLDLISKEAGDGVNCEGENDSLVTKESLGTLVRHAQSFKQPKSSEMHKDAETVSIVNEVSRLNERLRVLEADRTFIEHAIKALNDGQEELIQEIASHLRELHKVGIRRYQNSLDGDVPIER